MAVAAARARGLRLPLGTRGVGRGGSDVNTVGGAAPIRTSGAPCACLGLARFSLVHAGTGGARANGASLSLDY